MLRRMILTTTKCTYKVKSSCNYKTTWISKNLSTNHQNDIWKQYDILMKNYSYSTYQNCEIENAQHKIKNNSHF